MRRGPLLAIPFVLVILTAILLGGLALATNNEGDIVPSEAAAKKPIPRETRDVDVRITADGFEPRTLRIRPEQYIRFVNETDEIRRIAPVESAEKDPRTQGLASPALNPGDDWFFRPPRPGRIEYVDVADRKVRGVLDVR